MLDIFGVTSAFAITESYFPDKPSESFSLSLFVFDLNIEIADGFTTINNTTNYINTNSDITIIIGMFLFLLFFYSPFSIL